MRQLIGLALVGIAVSASAQQSVQSLSKFLPESHTAPTPSERFPAEWYGTTGSMERPVVKIPYSAVLVTTYTLPDVNGSPTRTLVSRVMWYRDSKGRTRTEEVRGYSAPEDTGLTKGAKEIEVTDPVSHCQFHWYEIDPDDPRAKQAQQQASVVCRALTVRYMNNDPFAEAENQTPQKYFKGNQIIERTPLGFRTINGVRALGIRQTNSEAKSADGKELAVEEKIVLESWWSPDLKVVVRFGPVSGIPGIPTFDLTEIHTEEPNPALFYPSPNYKIVKGNAF